MTRAKKRIVKSTTRASWDWVKRWSDDAENVRGLARDMQNDGIRAATAESIYVGHRTLAIHPEDIGLAVKFLMSMGESYIAQSYAAYAAVRR